MTRTLLIKLHFDCSAFFAAAIVLVAVSGGLYLSGIKGSIEQTPVATLATGQQLSQNPSEANVQAALASLGVADLEFEYVKQKGSQLITRTMTRSFYTLDISGDEAVVLFIILTGLWLGLSSARLRSFTVLILGAGVILFLWLALS
jgi:ABC-type uncharacterized transport system substrate-binding protein